MNSPFGAPLQKSSRQNQRSYAASSPVVSHY